MDACFVGSVDGTLRAVARRHAARPAVSSTAEYRSTELEQMCLAGARLIFFLTDLHFTDIPYIYFVVSLTLFSLLLFDSTKKDLRI